MGFVQNDMMEKETGKKIKAVRSKTEETINLAKKLKEKQCC